VGLLYEGVKIAEEFEVISINMAYIYAGNVLGRWHLN